MPKSYDEIPRESRPLLDSAVRVLKTHAMDTREVLMMVYNLGRTDGRMEQIERVEDLVDMHMGAKETLQ